MNYKVLITGLLAILAPILAKKGIVIPAEFGVWVSAIFVTISGFVANGIRLGLKDARTNITGVVAAAAVLLGTFGLELSPEFQAAIIGVALWIIGGFSEMTLAFASASFGLPTGESKQ